MACPTVLREPDRRSASTTTVPRVMPAMSRLRDRKRDRIGAEPGATSDTTRPCCGDALDQRGVRRRIGPFDAACEHRDGRPVDRERPSVRAAVDAEGRPGDDRPAPGGQPGSQVGGHLLAVGGGRAATRRPRPTARRHSPRWSGPAHPQTPRRHARCRRAARATPRRRARRAAHRRSRRSPGRARCRGRPPARRSGRAGPPPRGCGATVSSGTDGGDEPVHLVVARLGQAGQCCSGPPVVGPHAATPGRCRSDRARSTCSRSGRSSPDEVGDRPGHAQRAVVAAQAERPRLEGPVERGRGRGREPPRRGPQHRPGHVRR